ncbi:MAG TPA: hypothetical protein VF252_13420, partial [Gemmatimonadales bacterium]
MKLFVTVTALSAAAAAASVWPTHLSFPGWWPLIAFLFVSVLLETFNTQLRLNAKGSTSFIMYMAGLLLFGGWWAAVIAAVSTFLGEIARNNPLIKITFNVSQRILAVAVAALVYGLVGGELPAAYLQLGASWSSQAVQRDLGLFVVISSVYFLVSWAAVNCAIVLSSERAFREVWNLNTRGLLFYDIAASL